MLSNQASIPLNDNQNHRRQNSTPTGFEAQGIPIQPAPTEHPGFHRRGMSMTQRPIAQFRPPNQQDGHLVSMTNTGQQHPQHYLQVAQQQPQARPGHQQGPMHQLPLSEQEFRHLQHQQLDAQIDSLLRQQKEQYPFSMTPTPTAPRMMQIERSQSQPGAQYGKGQLRFVPQTQAGAGAELLNHYENTGGVLVHGDQVVATVSRTNWGSPHSRPYTSPSQTATVHSNLTPNASPHPSLDAGCGGSPQMMRSASQDNHGNAIIGLGKSPTRQNTMSTLNPAQVNTSPGRHDPNATIKARQHPGHFRGMSQASNSKGEQTSLPSPPDTAPFDSPDKFGLPFNSSPQSARLALFPGEIDFRHQGSNHTSTQTSPAAGPGMSPPMRQAMNHPDGMALLFIDPSNSNGSSPSNTGPGSVDFGYSDSPTRRPESSHGMSMEDLSLDATIEETGISAEEVQAYISQPHPESGKWNCLYPECGKTFGRKENVRAHVQTHLGDRQFKCVHCGKCFVRQHDLKRHAKTHSGVKPYPCRCGNSFARHDALTRHRQRGICTGGFEGVVKKVAKRGRPRKERPSHDDRMEKASKTRKRATEKSYASSVSGTSDSSFPESPPVLLSGINFETTQAHDLTGLSPSSLTLVPTSITYNFADSPFNYDMTPSPNKAQSTASGGQSPIVISEEANCNESESMQITEAAPAMTGSNVGSQVGSPPGLSHSSPPSSTRLLDFDFGSTFNSSGSAPAEEAKQSSHTTDFEELFANSPEQVATPWNESNFFNFDKDNNFMSGDTFTASFNDDILFSDNCERNDPFF